MGDPLGAARHIRESLAPDGTWLIVEPFAGDTVATTSTRSAGSTTGSRRSSACRTRCPSPAATHSARRPARRRSAQVVTEAGFTRFRRAAETPFNLVFEARR